MFNPQLAMNIFSSSVLRETFGVLPIAFFRREKKTEIPGVGGVTPVTPRLSLAQNQSYGGFHSHLATPMDRLFHGKSKMKWMIWGLPILGNLHMYLNGS